MTARWSLTLPTICVACHSRSRASVSRTGVRRHAAMYSASSLANTSCSSSLRINSWARAPRPIAVCSLSSLILFSLARQRRWRRRGAAVDDRFRRGSRHIVLMALARDLQVEELELLLERELLPLERELRVELHLLMRGVGGDLGLLGPGFRRDLGMLGIGRRLDRRRRRVGGVRPRAPRGEEPLGGLGPR